MTYPNKIDDPKPEHVADLKLISEALWRAKDAFNWCGEFESHMSRWSQQLRVDLPAPEPYISVRFRPDVTFRLPYNPDISPQENARLAQEEVHAVFGTASPEEMIKLLTKQEITSVTNYDTSVTTKHAPRDPNEW